MSDADDIDAPQAERERETAELRRRLHEEVTALRRLIEITGLLNSTLKLEDLLGLILSSAAELLHAEAGSLLLVDEQSGDLIFEVATRDSDQHLAGSRVPAGQGIAGWVVEHGQPLVVADPDSDSRFYREIDRASGVETRNILALPLTTRGRTIGVVEVTNKLDVEGFTDKDLELATALADQAAIAIENTRLYARLADAVVTSRMSYRL